MQPPNLDGTGQWRNSEIIVRYRRWCMRLNQRPAGISATEAATMNAARNATSFHLNHVFQFLVYKSVYKFCKRAFTKMFVGQVFAFE